MLRKPLQRALALLLSIQPTFWMSSVALAQTVQPPGTSPGSGGVDPGPMLPPPMLGIDTEAARAERYGMAPATPPPPVDQPVDPDKYICGPGDVLELNFWGVQNFKQRVTIDFEGRAFVTKVGYLNLDGKTLSQARRAMREAVARFWKLNFDLTLAEPRTFLVQVVDAVARPASYPARAVDRVATIIDRAGGYGSNASRRRVEIRRRDGSVIRADLLLYALTGDVKHNPHLLDGDVVRVPFEDLAATVEGAVNRPGRYELTSTRDLPELIELAGGLSPAATHLLPIVLVRREDGDLQDQRLLDFGSGGGIPAERIRHEDVVRIPGFAELQQSIMIVGAIDDAPESATSDASDRSRSGRASPEQTARRLPFVQGDSVRTLLDRAGGVAPDADLAGSYLLRRGESLPVDLHALVMLRDLKADRLVELGDTLVVPFKRRDILVEGAVFKPGAYPYNPTYGIEQYLSLAGGRSRSAQSVEKVRVVSPDGEMTRYEPDLKLEPGSSVVVPERNFSRGEVVQIILGVTGVLVSGVAVVLSARN